MKIKVDNGLTFDNKNEGFNEIKENELNYYTDIYSPGQTKQKLKIGREVEGSSNGGGKVKTLIFNRLASVGTGNQSFTGFGFTPTSYTVQTTRTGITATGYPCFSDGCFDGTTSIIRQVADGYSRVLTGYVGRLLYANQGGGITNIVHYSLDNDGITLNFTSSGEDCYLIITAFA